MSLKRFTQKTFHPSLMDGCIGILIAGLCGSVNAKEPLTCAEDKSTHAHMCFPDKKVRANGDVRAAPLFKGGPNGVFDSGFTVRVHCVTKVLELNDKLGIAFARNRTDEQLGSDFIRFLCTHKTVKNDAKLSTK